MRPFLLVSLAYVMPTYSDATDPYANAHACGLDGDFSAQWVNKKYLPPVEWAKGHFPLLLLASKTKRPAYEAQKTNRVK